MQLFVVLLLIAVASAAPTYPYPGVGAIFKGPDSSTIVKGPDGSVITSKTEGGAVEDSPKVLTPIAVGPAPVAVALPTVVAVPKTPVVLTSSPVIAEVYAADQPSIKGIPEAPAVLVESKEKDYSGLIIEEDPIKPEVVPEKVLLEETPIVVAEIEEDEAKLTGPSGSISTKGASSVVSGPASTTYTGPSGASLTVKKLDVAPAPSVVLATKALVAEPAGVAVVPQPVVPKVAVPEVPIFDGAYTDFGGKYY